MSNKSPSPSSSDDDSGYGSIEERENRIPTPKELSSDEDELDNLGFEVDLEKGSPNVTDFMADLSKEDMKVSGVKRPIRMIKVLRTYKVLDPRERNPQYFDKLKYIARAYYTNISTIYKLASGKTCKYIDIKVEKTTEPYLWRFRGDRTIHKSKNLREISDACGFSVATIANLALSESMHDAALGDDF